MRKLFAVFAVAFLCGATELRTGSPAPPLMLSQLMQAPLGVVGTWEALKGNVVVLEFWATWCGGYRAQIPHLNKLQKRFRNKPVQFLSITDEEPGIVQRFLKNHPISGWIGLDSNEQTFNRYGVIGRPVTVLVDASGVVRGIGSPSDLTKEIIGDLLAGKPIVFSLQATLPAKT
ncbi:MAG: TlpA disulfide reductase family protein, partial [Bryobacteraceae bacterium]